MKAAPGQAVSSVEARRYWNLLQLKMVNNYRHLHSAISLLLVRREREGTKTRWKDNTEGETTLCVLVINNSSSRTIEAPGDRSCRAVKNVSNECPPLAHLEEKCNSLSLIVRLALELETGADVWMTRCWGTPPFRDKLKQTRLQLTDWGDWSGDGRQSPLSTNWISEQYFTVPT